MWDLTPPLVLIVESDSPNTQYLSALLMQRGFRSLVVEDGSAALDLVDRLRPDLVALNLNLPDQSGRDVLEHLRAADHTRDIPTVVVSAEWPAEAIRALADGVIKQPCDPSDLLTVVEPLIWTQRRLQARAAGA